MSFLDTDLEIGTSSEPLTGTVEAAPATMVTVEPASVQTVFTTPRALDPLIAQIAAAVREHVPDVTTAAGRKAIASLAFRVAKTKTYLDGLGQTLVAGLKELPKRIDANRLDMRNQLDALRDEARKPLDVWEAEQAAIEATRKAEEAAAALALQVEHDHEMALLMDSDIDRKREDAKRAAEQARLDREDQIRKDAADRARFEAETRAKMEAEASMRREMEGKLALERAEREKAEAEQRTKDAEARAERERQESAQREERARQEAAEQERRRQDAEKAKEEAERKVREEDREHRKAFNQEALADIRAALEASDTDPAVSILQAIARGQIRHCTIAY